MDIDDHSFLNPEVGPIIQNFVNLYIYDEKKPLNYNHIQILNYFLKMPGNTTFDFYKCYKNQFESPRTPSRYTVYLSEEIGLLEIESQELIKGMISSYKKYCRLSLNGIVHLILNTSDITYEYLILSLLINYKENILFTFFLYPFLKEETLINVIGDSAIFSNITMYLRDICNIIIDSIRTLRNLNFTTKDGFLNEQVFVWYINPSNNLTSNFSTVNLRHFLRQDLGWNWIDKARITTNVDEHRIEILDTSNPQNKPYISIHKDDRKAVLRLNGKKLYQFSIDPNDSFLSIEAKTDRKSIDFMETSFFYRCKEHLLTFLTKLRTQVTPYNQSFDILSKDENFRKALGYLDNETRLK